MATEERLEKARASLSRVQEFDVSSLPREDELGKRLNFEEAVLPAKRVIDLFRQYPIQFLGDLADQQLNTVTSQADQFFNLLNQILKFSPEAGEAFNQRQSLIQQLKDQYQPIFTELMPFIAYGATRQRDFDKIEREFRAAMQRSDDAAA
jgi:hypothetical protein